VKEGGAPPGLAVISFFSGLEVEGWLNEARGLWPKMGIEDAGVVEGCDDVGRVVDGTELEDRSLKESLRLDPPRAACQK